MTRWVRWVWVWFAGAMVVLAQPASEMVQQTGIRGGLVIQLDCGDGTRLSEFAEMESFIAHGLDEHPEQIEMARQQASERGLSGKLCFSVLKGRQLPFVDNVANLIIADRTTLDEMEILRVLRPLGVAVIGGKKIVKPWPNEIGEWSHYLNGPDNNAVSSDRRIGPPQHMQWRAHPTWSRHHDQVASMSALVTARGVLYYINDNGSVQSPENPANWSLSARDGFNGLLLWTRPMKSWMSHLFAFRSGPVQLQRLLVADADRLYVPLGLGDAVSVLDATNGKTLRTLTGTENAEEILLSEGTLVALTGQGVAEQAAANANQKTIRSKSIKGIDPVTGKMGWQYPATEGVAINPRTLTLAAGCVFAQEKNQAVCIDLKSGQLNWKVELFEKGTEKSARRSGWTYNSFTYSDGVLLCAVNNRDLVALDAESGSTLWSTQAQSVFSKTPETEVYVIHGKVWSAPDFAVGRDLKTGDELVRNNLQESLLTAGHHSRCYRGKATERYIIQGYRGLEFRDLEGADSVRNNWIRGLCQYGILPANGMVYLPPHNCSCYFEAKLFGFWGLTAEQSRLDHIPLEPTRQIDKRTSFPVSAASSHAGVDDWPIYRHDAARSGCTESSVATDPKKSWEIQLGGRATPPVICGDLMACAVPDKNQVVACSVQDGTIQWKFTAPASVDSSPTFYEGALLFGCHDGQVYCLDAKTGQLVWRFRAAPMDLRTVAMGGVESLWPVHGSVLVHEGRVLFVAGRSTYLDGGLFAYVLDPKTGEVLHAERMMSDPATVIEPQSVEPLQVGQNTRDYKTLYAPDRSDSFSMQGGNLSDILSAYKGAIYLRHQQLDKTLTPTGAWAHHLFSSSRFLDENEAHRSHFLFGRGEHSLIPVAYEWMLRPQNKTKNGLIDVPVGKLVVFDQQHAWATPAHMMWNNALKIFDIDQIGVASRKDYYVGKSKARNLPPNIAKELVAPNATLNARDVGDELSFHPRALVKAGDHLIVGGMPQSKSVLRIYGQPNREKGILQILSADEGAVLFTQQLVSPPRFDGIAVAQSRIIIACEDGRILCYK